MRLFSGSADSAGANWIVKQHRRALGFAKLAAHEGVSHLLRAYAKLARAGDMGLRERVPAAPWGWKHGGGGLCNLPPSRIVYPCGNLERGLALFRRPCAAKPTLATCSSILRSEPLPL